MLWLGRGYFDPDRPDKYARTPLGNAAARGHKGVLKSSKERGDINPNRPTNAMTHRSLVPLGRGGIPSPSYCKPQILLKPKTPVFGDNGDGMCRLVAFFLF